MFESETTASVLDSLGQRMIAHDYIILEIELLEASMKYRQEGTKPTKKIRRWKNPTVNKENDQ